MKLFQEAPQKRDSEVLIPFIERKILLTLWEPSNWAKNVSERGLEVWQQYG